jgi:hypothetical protein
MPKQKGPVFGVNDKSRGGEVALHAGGCVYYRDFSFFI